MTDITAEESLEDSIRILNAVLDLIDGGGFRGRRLYWTGAGIRDRIVKHGGPRFSQTAIKNALEDFVSCQAHDGDPNRIFPSAAGFCRESIKAAAPEIAAEVERLAAQLAARKQPRPAGPLPDLESLRR